MLGPYLPSKASTGTGDDNNFALQRKMGLRWVN